MRRQRFLLAVLALEANHLVTTQRMIELAWPEHPPASARAVIHTNISGLRSLLARAGAEAAGLQLRTEGPGYLLRCPPERVDAWRFLALLREAEQTTEDHRRLAGLQEALNLWRGPVLAGVCDETVRARLGGWLEEARLDATEQRIQLQLRLGQRHRLAGELTRLVAEHPTRQRLVAQLMLTLYLDARVEEALAVYRQASRRLADHLCIDPPAMLQRLQVAILRQDPILISTPHFL